MFIQFQFISYITGFLIFPQNYTFSATQIHGHTLIYAIICLKNIYYYFISNAEKFITIMRMWFKIFNN